MASDKITLLLFGAGLAQGLPSCEVTARLTYRLLSMA
jgi:hypothetical protein